MDLIDTFSMVRDTVKDQLKTIITSPIEESDIEPFKMVKGLYKACMNKGETTEFCKLLLYYYYYYLLLLFYCE